MSYAARNHSLLARRETASYRLYLRVRDVQ